MRHLSARIGTVLSLAVFVLGLTAGPLTAHASASPSYQMTTGSPAEAVHMMALSPNFSFGGGLTWNVRTALQSPNFRILATLPDLPADNAAGTIPDWNAAPRLPGGGQTSPSPGGGNGNTGTPSRRTTSALAKNPAARAAPTRAAAPKATAPVTAPAAKRAGVTPAAPARAKLPSRTAAPAAQFMSPARPKAATKPAGTKAPVATSPSAKTSQFMSPVRPSSPAAATVQRRAPVAATTGRARPSRRVVQRSSPVASLLNGSPVAAGGFAALTAALTGVGIQRIVSFLPWLVTGVLVLGIFIRSAYSSLLAHAGISSERRRRSSGRSRRKARQRRARPVALLLLIAMLSLLLPSIQHVSAAVTVPQKHVYSGHLLDAAGKPVVNPVTIRFSYWKSPDALPTDVVSGVLNTGAPNYVGWQEVQTVTPDGKGFFSLQLGSSVPLPDLSSMPAGMLLSLYLQVEVKPAPAPATAYELLDTDPGDATVDRSSILSVPFALNADRLDQRDTGTASGSIMVLGSGGVIPVSAVAGGTNQNSFTLNNDDSAATSIALTFGKTLARTLSYDLQKAYFNFNASVNVQGNLTVSGKINGVSVTAMEGTGALKVFSGGGLSVKIGGGSYRINGNVVHFGGSGSVSLPPDKTTYLFFTQTGSLVKATGGFPTGISYIPLAQVTTSAGSVQTVVDRRALQSDDREETGLQVLHPAYESAAYQADASDNVGQLSVTTDNSTLKNYYAWTSSRGTLQDYDILVRTTLPPDFVQWRDSITLAYRSTSGDTANNKAEVQIYDSNGNPVSLSGATSNLASTSWTTTHIEFTGSPTWTAGSEFMMRIRAHARSDFQMHIGDIRLDYTTLSKQ